MQDCYSRRDSAAREWKEQGGKVVGYFCDSVPEELILAAGFLPLRLSGDPNSGTELARKNYVPRARNREDFVHSMLNMLLSGQYDYLDYLVVPHARETIRRLYQVLLQVKETNPETTLPELYYLDVLHTTFFTSGLYNRERLLGLKKQLEIWSGQAITDDMLSEAIAVTNESKRLMQKMAACRTEAAPKISGTDALQIIGSSMFMSKKQHNELLGQYLQNIPPPSGPVGIRLFLAGSPLDNLQLYRIIESLPATIVAEDNCWGNRIFETSIDTTLDPFEAIAERYLTKPPCNRIYPLSRRVEYCVASAGRAGADAAIIFVYERDSAEAWEVPDKIQALESAGIPVLYLKQQPYLIENEDAIRSRVNEFLSSINTKNTSAG